jgi:predicted ATPase/class 3 adenylate cyclase
LTSEIRLGPLDGEQIEAMLQAVLGRDRPVRRDLLETVTRFAEGNPFFIEEVLPSLLQSGATLELRIPRSVEDAVRRRIELLSGPARQTLLLAAVIGQRVDFAVLQDVSRASERELLEHLKELVGRQLVIEESAERFAFRHALTRAAIYGDLLARERRLLHEQILESIQGTTAHVSGHLTFQSGERRTGRPPRWRYIRRGRNGNLRLRVPLCALTEGGWSRPYRAGLMSRPIPNSVHYDPSARRAKRHAADSSPRGRTAVPSTRIRLTPGHALTVRGCRDRLRFPDAYSKGAVFGNGTYREVKHGLGVGQQLVSELLTGTVTFLLTDIEGSTRLWERHPEAMRSALTRHDTLIEQLVAEHGGTVVRPRGEGDSRFVVFAQSRAAVAAACAILVALYQESWALPEPLRVRVALHTGEADVRDGDYYGTAVNRCARLRALAYGGQVLLSGTTAALVRDQLPGVIALRSLGTHRLKDLAEPEPVYQLLHPELPHQFPPLQSAGARRGILPAQPTPLIGRERELEEVLGGVRRPEVRLVTLIGPGGVGKTRLAIAIAERLQESFAEGAWFVDLSAVSDPALVPTTVAQVLGVRETGGRPVLELLIEHLRDRQLLLVVDNFEHVLEAAPAFTELLAASAEVKVLTTSREQLGVRWERVFGLQPLAVPRPNSQLDFAGLAAVPSVALFVERARAGGATFPMNETNTRAIAAICAKLDGLPLAIELAAARARLMPPVSLHARLSKRLDIFGGPRDAPTRHSSLGATVDWSYELLSPSEQVLFGRLGVFVGGWTEDAAQTVCGPDESSVLEGLLGLAERSLLRADDTGEELRFTMLATIREYSAQRLSCTPDADQIRRKHAAYFMHFAEQAAPRLTGPDQSAWLTRLEREYGNLRAALEWSLETADGETGLRLGTALRRFWLIRGYTGEGNRWLESLFAQPSGEPMSTVRCEALGAAGVLAGAAGDYERAADLLHQALAYWRAAGYRQGVAQTLSRLGSLTALRGQLADSRTYVREALALYRDLGDDRGAGVALANLGVIAFYSGQHSEAERLSIEARDLLHPLGDRDTVGRAVITLGLVAQERGEHTTALTFLRESLATFQELGDRAEIVETLELLAGVLATIGQAERAAWLFSAATRLLDMAGLVLPHATTRHRYEEYLERVRSELGEAAFDDAWRLGQGLTMEAAIEQATGSVSK